MPTKRISYTDIAGSQVKHRETTADADDLPTLGKKGKVYFKYKGLIMEADLSPGAVLVKEGAVRKLTQGHLRTFCPGCASEGRANPLHIDAGNKTCYLSDADKDLLHYVAPSNGQIYLLPTLTVMEPIACNYREGSLDACTWRGRIINGHAEYIGGAGQIFMAR